jgi:pimeloyl-ACP methyl ester carboxylesterase
MQRLKTLGLAVGAAAALVIPRLGPAQGTTLAESPCRLSSASLPAAFARCGELLVPEDPARPEGAQVKLFVARIASQSANPRPDPLLIITGGPGQSTADFYLEARGAFEPARRERELILVDQRGTGRSAEGFGCNVPEDLALETAGAPALMAFLDKCIAGLRHDPRFYSTTVAVQDLDRVRAALGIEQWDVYGISYGTRVAQHYLRRFPDRVRAIVLDGVVPPDLALGPDVAREAQRALDRIFERCAADARCAARFPGLPAEFEALLAKLAAEPVDMPEPTAKAGDMQSRFTDMHLRALVRFLSYNQATVALIPLLIDQAHTGNYEALFGQARTTLRGLPESLSFPMSNSVLCTEDVPFFPEGAAEGLDDTYLGRRLVDATRTICSRWPAGSIDPDFKTMVSAATPALLLSGSNDPITPPAYAEHVIEGGLHNSTHLVGRDQGHGLLLIGCMPRLLREFLEKPEPKALDAGCLALEPPTPFFLSPFGPAP